MADEPKQRGLTLADIAKRAGVSRSLASLALRGEPGVQPEKRAKILRVAAQMNYRPNPLARNLASAETRTIGLVIGQILNPFIALLAREIDEVAREQGYDILLSINGSPDEAAQRSIDGLMAHRVAGIILVDAPTSHPAIAAVGRALPVVYVGRQLSALEIDTVSTDDVLGAGLVVDHLADLGHRRIAHVDGGVGAGARRRREGFAAAMIRRGLEPVIVAGAYSIDGGAAGALQLMTAPAPPTAIFAANDLAALGVMNHLVHAGHAVPRDVAVVGYDDMPLAAAETISLTTVHQPVRRLAEQSLDSLVKRIRAPDAAVLRALVSPRLVVRRSSGA